jgi:hypothetical protein
MGAGLTITPVSGVFASDYARPAADAAPAATATAVADAGAARPAADTNATVHEAPAPVIARSLTQKFTTDPQTRELIYQLVDELTQQVIQQVPDQALLASRAYSNAIHNGATPLEAEIQASIAS